MKPEKSIPDAILRQAKGLAIITVVKVGMMVTYNIGTGLVIAHREDGSWSPPSAISSLGVGWGAQVIILSLFALITLSYFYVFNLREHGNEPLSPINSQRSLFQDSAQWMNMVLKCLFFSQFLQNMRMLTF